MSIRVADVVEVNLPETLEPYLRARALWQAGLVSIIPETRWLTVPDLVELLGIGVSRVRRLIEDRAILAIRVDGVIKVPASFIRDGEPLSELKGTLVLLADSGFTDDEAMRWLLGMDGSLGTSPIEALRAGRKAEVRRVAQALAF